MNKVTTTNLQTIYELFDAHCGTWEGTYAITDAAGNLIDFHQSHLELQRTGDKWKQKNTYTWADGKTKTFVFEGAFNADGELEFDTERLIGKAWKSGHTILLQWEYQDGTERLIGKAWKSGHTILLQWEYQDGISNRNFEQINMLGAGKRMRSWQLSREGEPIGHVLISETQTSKDCPSFN